MVIAVFVRNAEWKLDHAVLSIMFEQWRRRGHFKYRIFRTIRRTQKQLIFSKTDSAPYSPVRLIYVSNC